MFMVTVPLLEELTGGTEGVLVTCWADTGPGVALTGTEA